MFGAAHQGARESTPNLAAKCRSHIPELDGLRGIAVAAVVLYHCHDRLASLHLASVAEWGWAGVNLFFVLSGFLITGILAGSRSDVSFFRNFYARRALRIWPLYVLLLAVYYFVLPVVFHDFRALGKIRTAPWLLYAGMVQNLSFRALPGPLVPTWSLAIEEQFYLLWAPAVRMVTNRWLMAALAAMLVASPLIRMSGWALLTPTNTLLHLDGLAMGGLLALLIRTWRMNERQWRMVGYGLAAIGFGGLIALRFRGSAFTDSLLAAGFGGMVLLGVVASGRASRYGAILRSRGLLFLGRISYGLYMVHILCFVVVGSFDRRMAGHGAAGDAAVVAVRLTLSILVATALWYGFESRILRLKRHFMARREEGTLIPTEAPGEMAAAASCGAGGAGIAVVDAAG